MLKTVLSTAAGAVAALVFTTSAKAEYEIFDIPAMRKAATTVVDCPIGDAGPACRMNGAIAFGEALYPVWDFTGLRAPYGVDAIGVASFDEPTGPHAPEMIATATIHTAGLDHTPTP